MTVPPEAVTAADAAIRTVLARRWKITDDPHPPWLTQQGDELATAALEAAAPLIAAAERDRIRQLAVTEADRKVSLLSTFSGDDALRHFADLLLDAS